MTNPERTITESTAQELMASIGMLNTNMARFDEQLIATTEKLKGQDRVNVDIEARMRLREKDAGTLEGIVNWKRSVNGFFISVGTALAITIALALLYLAFGAKP